MKIISKIWRDEQGGISSGAYLLLVTIVALGMVVGAATLRDQVIQELGDIGVALTSVDQSFTVNITLNGNQIYNAQFADPAGNNLADPNGAPACLQFNIAPVPEGTAPPAPQPP